MDRMTCKPYLFFDGRCAEALEFYRRAVGAEVRMVMRFRDAPAPQPIPGGSENRVLHATLQIGDATVFACDEASPRGGPGFGGFSLVLTAASVGEAEDLFARLSDGGRVRMGMVPTFWSPAYGMVFDRFGVPWAVMAE